MSVKFKPAEGRVLIKRSSNETSAGGIILPNSSDKSDTGEIIGLGEGKMTDAGNRQTVDFKVGDKVLFSKYAGTDVKIQDKDFVVVGVEDIMGVFE